MAVGNHRHLLGCRRGKTAILKEIESSSMVELLAGGTGFYCPLSDSAASDLGI